MNYSCCLYSQNLYHTSNAFKKRKHIPKHDEFSDIPQLEVCEHIRGDKFWLSLLLQLWDMYSKNSVACLTGEELGDFIQNLDVIESEDRAADPCWQVKWHLGKLIKKVFGTDMLKWVELDAVWI